MAKTKTTATKAPAKKTPAKAAPATKAPATKAPAKAAPAEKAAPKKTPARGSAAPSSKAGVQFKDAGFRLAVINELLGLGHFEEALEAAREAGGDVEDYEIDPVVQRAVDGFVLTPELLAKVTSLCPDGGDDIYDALIPVWDGESDEFDIASLEDVKLLPNLTKVSLHAMCAKGIDLRPLADAPKLEEANVSFGKSWAKGHAVFDVLRKRGVAVKASG